ncbi:MAG: hypothetical protein GX579_09590 [Chloroflexi bacterium]|nr:hypothetical protein [Chloroflexota bacterium]
MAKKQQETERDDRRLSRKEVLLARRQRERTRQIRLAVGLIVGLLVLVALVAVVVEGFVRPAQAVIRSGDDQITLEEWQNRVRFQRAQFITAMEDQLEMFGGDIGLIQQFNQQQISLLLQPELLGELVLEQMANEILIEQEAAARGIEVTEAEVTARIEEGFNYFGGVSPTPLPTATQTVQPTPSLTPYPTSVITEVLPTATTMPTPTQGPTSTPLPTATPVSEEAFREEYQNLLDRYADMGIGEETYRSVVYAQLLREKLAEALAEEEEMSTEAEHASLYVLSFESAEEAEQATAAIEESGFLDVWNRIRSLPDDDEAALPGSANEVIWQTQDAVEQRFGAPVAEAAFELDLNEVSDVIEHEPGIDELTGTEQPTVYYIIMVTGREVRELPDSTLESMRLQLVSDLIDPQRAEEGRVEILSNWQGHAPTRPVLDPIFLQQPTPVPGSETATPAPATETPEAETQ